MNQSSESPDASIRSGFELDLLVPVSAVFLAVLPFVLLIDGFSVELCVNYLLTFAGLLFLFVAMKSASELKQIYETSQRRYPLNSRSRIEQPITHRHFMYSVHIFFAATFMVLVKFDWQFGSKISAVFFLIAMSAAIYCAVRVMFVDRHPARGSYYRQLDSLCVAAWPVLLLMHMVLHMNLGVYI